MKILFTSDYQLGWKLYNNPDLGQDLVDTFIRTVDKAIELKVDCMVVCGDLFDNVKPTEELVKVVKDQVVRLDEADIAYYGLAGDHDLPNSQGTAWINVCGFKYNSDRWPTQGQKIHLLHFNNNPQNVMHQVELLKETPKAKTVEFICFHGMVPEMYHWLSEKKVLDFLTLDYKPFPNLKYLIGGDLHNSTRLKFTANNGNAIVIEYCGSPAVIKSDEVGHKQGLLYYNGNELTRIPFELEREFIKIDYSTTGKDTFDVAYYQKEYKKKPVFLVETDSESTKDRKPLKQLHDIGFVYFPICRKADGAEPEEIINIRSELGTGDRIPEVLKESCKEQAVYNLTYDIINGDVKAVLDKFKYEVFK